MTSPPADLVELAEAITVAMDEQDLLTALTLLHRLRAALDEREPQLISAARHAGVSWQALAAVLGVASRQAAERRYLRLIPATPEQSGSTRDQRVRQVRDRRAATRAVSDWANDNTADLRRLAAQVASLDGLKPEAAGDVGRLSRALGDPDATALPGLLAQARRHLDAHPALARRIDAVTADTTRIRRQIQHSRDGAPEPGERIGT
jgi:hypothetical protein